MGKGSNNFVRFRAIAVFLTAVMCWACFSPASASALEPNALLRNGIAAQGELAGGVLANGTGAGGTAADGAAANGIAAQGGLAGGALANGTGAGWTAANGAAANGIAAQGELAGGALANGTGANGAAADGAAGSGIVSGGAEGSGLQANGTEAEGTETDGAESDGTDTDGTENDGTEAEGSETGGTEPDGTESDGTEADGTETDGIEADEEGGPDSGLELLIPFEDDDPFFIVTLDPNGGTLPEGTPPTIEVPEGTAIGFLPIPTNGSKGFEGWWTKSTGGEQVDETTEINEDLTIFAIWSSAAWEVTFDANGGTLAPGVHEKVYVAPGMPLDTAIDPLPIPSYDKLGFTGWWTEPSGGEQVDGTTEIYEDMTLFAGWTEDVWAVTFNANGGTLAPGVPATVYVAKTLLLNTAIAELPDGTQATRVGYELKGWYTAKTGGTAVHIETMEPKKDVTYYAVWTAKSYILEFDVNTDDPTALVKAYGAKADTAAEIYSHPTPGVYDKKYSTYFKKMPVATRTGYSFAGWYTSDGVKKTLSSKITIASGEGDTDGPITLYAKWTQKKYSITFNANGGKMVLKKNKISKWKKSVKFDDAYGNVPGAIGAPLPPTRAGFEFDGWWTRKGVVRGDDWGDVIAEADEDVSLVPMTVSKSHTLYAKWKPIVYTIDFEANGGDQDHLDGYQGFQKGYGTTWGLPSDNDIEWPVSVRTVEQIEKGLIFKGWSLSAKKNGAIVDGKVWKTAPKNLTLYAQYTNKATIVLVPNGGKVSPKSKTVAVKATVYPKLPTPKRTGYSPTGWYYENDENDLILQKKGDPLPLDLIDAPQSIHAVILTAEWEPKKYKVSFSLNGGAGLPPDSIEVTYDETYAFTDGVDTGWPYEDPVRTGYTFKGWYTTKSGSKKIDGDTAVKITKKTTLYAQWTANQYNVTFDANGGFFGTVPEKDVVQTFNKNYKLPSKPRNPGHTLSGWYTKDGSGNAWGSKVTTSVKVKRAEDHTLYAKWKAIDISAEADVIVTGTGSGWHGKIVLYNPTDGTAISFGIQHDNKSALGFPGRDCLMFESIGKSGQVYRAFKAVSSGKHHIRIEYDNARKVAIGYCDGVFVGEMASPKMGGRFAVGFEASSRLTGDTVDASFTNLVIYSAGKQTTSGAWLETKRNGTFNTKLITNGDGGPPAGSEGAKYATKNGWHLWGKANLPGGDWDSYPEVGAKRIIGFS